MADFVHFRPKLSQIISYDFLYMINHVFYMQSRKKSWLSQPGFEPLTLDNQYSYKIRQKEKKIF